MAVAADLDVDAAHRRAGEVGRHDAGGAAVEGERRLQHAAIAQRHQLRLARRIGGAKDADRIRSIMGRPPAGVLVAGHGVAPALAVRLALRRLDRRDIRYVVCAENLRFHAADPP